MCDAVALRNCERNSRGMQRGFVHGRPRLLLRIEGLAYAALALIGYAHSGYSWWLLRH
jgi:hypothetical protein